MSSLTLLFFYFIFNHNQQESVAKLLLTYAYPENLLTSPNNPQSVHNLLAMSSSQSDLTCTWDFGFPVGHPLHSVNTAHAVTQEGFSSTTLESQKRKAAQQSSLGLDLLCSTTPCDNMQPDTMLGSSDMITSPVSNVLNTVEKAFDRTRLVSDLSSWELTTDEHRSLDPQARLLRCTKAIVELAHSKSHGIMKREIKNDLKRYIRPMMQTDSALTDENAVRIMETYIRGHKGLTGEIGGLRSWQSRKTLPSDLPENKWVLRAEKIAKAIDLEEVDAEKALRRARKRGLGDDDVTVLRTWWAEKCATLVSAVFESQDIAKSERIRCGDYDTSSDMWTRNDGSTCR